MGKTHQTTIINAPVDKVWKALRNFHDMSWSKNVITELKTVGDTPGDRIGAGRLLNGVFTETLRELDDENRSFSYTIDDGPKPISKDDVQNYVGRVRVMAAPEGKGTSVEWTSSWEGAEEATEFCHGIYVALLGDMKESLE